MLRWLSTYRGIGLSVAALGLIILVLAATADLLGYGDTTGLGRKQLFGIGLGTVVIAIGRGLAMRRN
jgi:hypothetical protein